MPARFWWLSALCACLPDADVIGFAFGVHYGDLLGHRGLTHSLAFALVVGVVVVGLGFRSPEYSNGRRLALVAYFFVVTASHGILDAFTNGGLGIAFFAPFDNSRYFFPWRPLQVPPIGVIAFFSSWGLRVLRSELIWIGIPCLSVWILTWLARRRLR